MSKRYYKKHVYINRRNGVIDNPRLGNILWSQNPEYESIGYFHSYSSLKSILDVSTNEWVITQNKKELFRVNRKI